MKRRHFLTRTGLLGMVLPVAGCIRRYPPVGVRPIAPPPRSPIETPADARFAQLRDRYFRSFLRFHPVTATFLGAGGWDASLGEADGRLRDLSPAGLDAERAFHRSIQGQLAAIPLSHLSGPARIDHPVMEAQARFSLHLLDDLRMHERAVDSYVAETFRGLDWQIQQMATSAGAGKPGSLEWTRLKDRILTVPRYFQIARANLEEGRRSRNLPDHRLLERDGIEAAEELASWFRKDLQPAAEKLMRSPITWLSEPCEQAARAVEEFAAFLATLLPANDERDRYACGEAEYAWRLKNCLRVDSTTADLWELGARETTKYQDAMFEVAKRIATRDKLTLAFGTVDEKHASTRAVMDRLSKDTPKNDDEMFRWYREAGDRSIAYGRERQMFEIPADYAFAIDPTPPVLRNSIDAAYYPAPAFKPNALGHFYLTPTENDPAKLSLHTRGYVADTAVHEGFPGHDWNYVFMNRHAREISNVRWLCPGSVEDSSSMWADSMASEGWGLYAEELMAEPAPGKPFGFYSDDEYLYELQGQLLRAARVRLDVGLHTGRMTFDEAVEWYSVNVNFFSRPCERAATEPQASALCDDAEHQVHRYAKWPTQAITYLLGKNEIQRLREEARKKAGANFSPRRFHEAFMKMGTIPPGYFAAALLDTF